MIQIKYKELFDIEFIHPYYLSGKTEDVQLAPTAECRVLLNYFGLRFIPTPFGAKIYAKVNTAGGVDVMANPLKDGAKFSFTCILKKRNFENFTRLNLKKEGGQFYYFNNLVNNLSEAGAPLLVADTVSKVVSDADLLTFVSNNFSYVHTDPGAQQAAVLGFTDSGEVFSQQLANHNNIFNFSFDLAKSPAGRANFSVEGDVKKSLYVINSAEKADLFGIIEIFHKSTLPAQYKFQGDDNAVVAKSYKVSFANRYTKWRYHITRKFNQAITGVTVGKTNGMLIVFSPKPAGGPGQFIMESNDALPLIEDPITGIRLADQTNNVIIPNLPNPPLNLVVAEGADIFSEILITI